LLLADARSTTLEQALLNLAFYRAFLRRFDNRATNHIILLPIPKNQGEHALIACAWLSMLDALWQGRGDKQPWRGNYSIAPRASGKVILSACFGKAHEAFTTSMLASDPDPAVLLDLCNEQDAWRNHRLYAEVSYALARLLADPALSLFGLCEFLQDVGHKLEDSV
jgi:type VI secretion system protein ImpM